MLNVFFTYRAITLQEDIGRFIYEKNLNVKFDISKVKEWRANSKQRECQSWIPQKKKWTMAEWEEWWNTKEKKE